MYAWVYYLLGRSTLWLALAYVVLVLPYAYRSMDAGLRAIDVATLAEAARSLGASWFTVMRRIVLPNLRSAVLSASFLSVALVLGEFTIAYLFSKKNLQVAMYELGKSDAKISVAVACSPSCSPSSCCSPCPSSAASPPAAPPSPGSGAPRADRARDAKRRTDAHRRGTTVHSPTCAASTAGSPPSTTSPCTSTLESWSRSWALGLRQDHRAALPGRASRTPTRAASRSAAAT